MKKILASLVILLASTATIAAPSSVLFQAGSIEEGQVVTITQDSGIASYFQDGTSGYVTFSCTLTPLANDEDVKAILYPGKNFQNDKNRFFNELNNGDNGSYTWYLANKGNEDGNIRIRLLKGSAASLKCQGTYTPEPPTAHH